MSLVKHMIARADLDFCSDFRLERNIYSCGGFFLFSSIENIVFNKTLIPMENVDSLESKLKRFFPPISLGSLKIAILAILWTNLCAL